MNGAIAMCIFQCSFLYMLVDGERLLIGYIIGWRSVHTLTNNDDISV